jgi:hypothetical protein
MWRMKVLRRLKSLLSAMVAYKSHQGKNRFGQAGDLSENTACSRGKALVFVLLFIPYWWKLFSV